MDAARFIGLSLSVYLVHEVRYKASGDHIQSGPHCEKGTKY